MSWLRQMRKKVQLTVVKNEQRKTDSFTLGFESGNPRVAQSVVSQIASLYIEENLKVREEQTVGVSAFIDNELKETEVRLKQQEAKLSDFKLRNMGQLPEQETANLAVLNRLQIQLQGSIENVNRLQDQLKFQERLLEDYKVAAKSNNAMAMVNPALPAPPPDPTVVELENKKVLYKSLLKRYTPDHPDVRKLATEIAVLEEKVAKDKTVVEGKTEANTQRPASQFELQILQIKNQTQDLNAQIKRGLQEQDQIRKDMAIYQAKVDMVPRVEQMQKEISRDYEITSKHYQELLAKKNEAEMASSLEKRQKGEQFRILDPANFPKSQSSPIDCS